MWAAVAVALAVMAGCSGDDDDAASDTTAPPASAAPGASTTVRPVDTSFTGQNSAQFCTLARTYNERSSRVGAAPTAAELRSVTREGQTAISQAAGAAPAEIKKDVDVIAAAFNSLVSEMEKVNFEVARLPPSALNSLSAPEFTQSTTRFQSYLRTVCGVTG